MRVDAAGVIGRRRDEQARLIATAERFAAQLEPSLGVRAVVIFGSVARGDFNVWSDIDVLVVADGLPDRPLDRLAVLGSPEALVHPVAWTEVELRRELARSNPIVTEVKHRGIWLRGEPDIVDFR
jgi:hypothetical protein